MKPWGWGIVSIAAWVLLQLWGLQVPIFADRVSLPEPDDSYCYIAKAASLESDFLQRSNTLESLRDQFTVPHTDLAKGGPGWERERQYHRIHYHYGLLFSAILVLLRWMSGTWEAAYFHLTLGGLLLLGVSLFAWLRKVVSPAAACVTVVVLAGAILPSHGLHTIVPGTLALMLGFFAWSLADRDDRRGRAGMLLLCLLSLAAHPTGLLYAAIAFAFHFLRPDGVTAESRGLRGALSLVRRSLPYRRRALREVGFGLGTLALLAAAWIASGLPDRPFHALHFAQPRVLTSEWFREVNANARTAAGLVSYYLRTHGVWGIRPLGAIFAAISLFVLVGRRRECGRFWLAAMAAATLFAASILFVLPGYPGEAAYRLWVPFAVMLTAGLAETLTRSVVAFAQAREKPLSRKLDLAFALCLTAWAAHRLLRGPGDVASQRDATIQRMFEIAPNSLQVAAVNEANNERSIVFTDETAMYYFIAQGIWTHSALYLPAARGTPTFTRLSACDRVGYVVSTAPVGKLGTGESVTIARGGDSANGLGLRIRTSGAASYELDGEVGTLAPDGRSHELSVGPTRTTTLRNTGRTVLSLIGIRASAVQSTAWPWGEDITVTFPTKPPIVLRDPLSQIPSELSHCGWRLQDDVGASMLFERAPSPPF